MATSAEDRKKDFEEAHKIAWEAWEISQHNGKDDLKKYLANP